MYNITNSKGYLNANEFVKFFMEKYKYKLLGGKPMEKIDTGRRSIGYKELQQNLIKELEENFDEVTVKMVSSCMFFLVRTGEDKEIIEHLDNLNPYSIYLMDGMFNIKDRILKKYTELQSMSIKNFLPYSGYDLINAGNPKEFIKFLKQIFSKEPDIQDNIKFIQEFMGLLLIPNTKFEKALFIFGSGGNGKGVLLNTIHDLLGEMNCSSAGINELMDKTTSYNLIGKLCNIDYDIFSQAYLDKEIVKKIISGERIITKQLYSQPISFKPFARIICASNYMPKVKHVDKSVTRRFFFMELKNSFVGSEDIYLKDKLSEEKKQILVWAIKGAQRLLEQNTFTIPKQILENERDFLRQEI